MAAKRMLVAGVPAPTTLDELESHLREEIKRQMDSGRDAASAFAVAAEKIGQPEVLKSEFRRSRGFHGDGWGEDWRGRGRYVC